MDLYFCCVETHDHETGPNVPGARCGSGSASGSCPRRHNRGARPGARCVA